MRIITYLLLLLFSGISYSQNSTITPSYVATYSFVSPSDTVKFSYHSPEKFILISNGLESRFTSTSEQFNDSMLYEFKTENPGVFSPTSQEEMNELFAKLRKFREENYKSVKSSYQVVKLLGENTVKTALYASVPSQHMELSTLTSWVLTGQSSTLYGLQCQEATIDYGGRKYNAWFTPEIPVSDGPYVFGGLPGLIVKISDSQNWYTFELLSVKSTPKSQYFWGSKFFDINSQKISRSDYIYKSEEYKNNPSFAGTISQSEEFQLRKRKEMEDRFFLLIERQ